MLARIATGMLLACLLPLALASFFSTTDPGMIYPTLPYLPPEGIHFKSPTGELHLRPFILRRQPVNGHFGMYAENEARLVPLYFLVRTSEPYGFGRSAMGPLRWCGFKGESPDSSPHFLGTDEFGRDIWSRLLYGGRTTVAIGLAASLSAALIAVTLGLVAGLFRGWVDALLMRVVEIMISVPWFYLLLAVRALLPLRTSPWSAVVTTTTLLALVGWARPARVLRGAASEARQRAYVISAQASGASRWHIARWHILPDLAPQAITQFTILLPQFIASEIALSFFGLGVDDPLVSWGGMLAAAQHLSSIVEYPWLMSPLWAMLPLFFAIHLLADQYGCTPTLTMPFLSRLWNQSPEVKARK